ncbi:MAG: peptide ABC transporter substrate-binding protein [Phycisphaerales bacterium]|jgi:oligopeptide transport system substrate-binding protein
MRRLVIAAGLVCVLLALAMRSGTSPRADFAFINRGGVSTLDYSQMSWMQDFRVARLISEGLCRRDVLAKDYATIPGVAASWDVSPDARTYTFHLRPDAKWSNGDPVTASDFVYTWRRAMLPELGSDYAKLLGLIRGGQAFMTGRAAALKAFAADGGISDRAKGASELWERAKREFDVGVGLHALDARTLQVELERSVPYFLDLMAFPAFFPMHAASLEAASTIDAGTGGLRLSPGALEPPRLITNGPFMLTQWRFKREMRFERNPHYWNPARLAIDSISIPTIEDGNAQVMAFRTGVVDWTSDVPGNYVAKLLADKRAFLAEHAADVTHLRASGLNELEIDQRLPADPRGNIHTFPSFGTYFYNFNCREKLADGRPNPFADAKVRRAFVMSVDKQSLVDNVRRTGEPVATTLIPPGSIAGYETPAGLAFDPAAARALLEEALQGKALPEVEILFNQEGGHDLIAQAIARDWQRNLGVSVRLVQKEVRAFREDVKGGNFMVSRATWFGDYGDPTTFLDLNVTGNGNNDRGYSSPRYDLLMEQASRELDGATRMKLLASAEKIIDEEDVPLMPLFQYVQIYLFDAHRVKGITTHPRQEQSLDLVDIRGDGKGAW